MRLRWGYVDEIWGGSGETGKVSDHISYMDDILKAEKTFTKELNESKTAV